MKCLTAVANHAVLLGSSEGNATVILNGYTQKMTCHLGELHVQTRIAMVKSSQGAITSIKN